MLNQIQPIETVPFQLIMWVLIVALIAIIYLVYRLLSNRIDSLESSQAHIYRDIRKTKDSLQEDVKELEQALRVRSTTISERLNHIQRELFKPLYQVGNYIEYNRGINGKQGVHMYESGRIVDVYERNDAEAGYLVDGTEGNGVEVNQSDITAWSE